MKFRNCLAQVHFAQLQKMRTQCQSFAHHFLELVGSFILRPIAYYLRSLVVKYVVFSVIAQDYCHLSHSLHLDTFLASLLSDYILGRQESVFFKICIYNNHKNMSYFFRFVFYHYDICTVVLRLPCSCIFGNIRRANWRIFAHSRCRTYFFSLIAARRCLLSLEYIVL